MKNKICKYYYIYLITNNVTNRQYIGSRMYYKDNIDSDKYMGSSRYLKMDYIKYGIENFSKQIIDASYTNKLDMLNAESKYILEYNTLEPNGYNRYLPNTSPGFHTGGCKHSPEAIEKIKKYKKTEEHKSNLSKSLMGITRSAETRLKYSKAKKYTVLSQETRDKMSKKHEGVKRGKYRKHNVT